MEIISLLEAVVTTMDTIPVVGIDNQDKFVGCANAIKTVIRQLQAVQSEKTAQDKPHAETEE